ncbi:MAG: orotidine-5'-phosphate decarboxylase [Verrucomicrobiota bacterium]
MKLPTRPQDKIIIALDVPDTDGALRLLDSIADLGEPPVLCKIGLELFTAEGPSVVKAVKARGCEIFLDLKFHDIPNTVAHAIRSAAGLGVAMTTLHAVGGPVMMEAAAKAAAGTDLLLLAVTVLTSMDYDQLSSTGINVEPKEQVLRLAGLAAKAGIGGIVCSPLEISAIRQSFDEKLRIVTPGVRPIWAAAGDQKRVMTPAEAVAAGSDWLVIGRPITAAERPKEAYAKVVGELS